MAKITALTIQTKNKNRCNLFLDGEFFRGLSIGVAYKYRLKEGMEIDAAKLEEIISIAEEAEATDKAVEYLSKYLKTKKQLKTYLLSKGYEEKLVYKVIDKLTEYKYIDDIEFSKRYIESVSNRQGKKLTAYKLMSKGVKKEDIEEAYESVTVDAKGQAELIAKKHIRNKELTKENIQKTYRYLISKGFSYEEAGHAISKLGVDTEETEEP